MIFSLDDTVCVSTVPIPTEVNAGKCAKQISETIGENDVFLLIHGAVFQGTLFKNETSKDALCGTLWLASPSERMNSSNT
jgi:hypothetical protein